MLEEGFAARVGRKHGVAVCNGSVALDAAVAALGLGPGDEVILPSFTIISCAAAILRAGAIPVLVDCEHLEHRGGPHCRTRGRRRSWSSTSTGCPSIWTRCSHQPGGTG
jgi:hypothetical protein